MTVIWITPRYFGPTLVSDRRLQILKQRVGNTTAPKYFDSKPEDHSDSQQTVSTNFGGESEFLSGFGKSGTGYKRQRTAYTHTCNISDY